MKKAILLSLLWMLGLCAPAFATQMLNIPVTVSAGPLVSPSLQLRTGPGQSMLPNGIVLQANFTWTSGGTSADAWVQTSLDGGVTWNDVANFHFTTASARFVYSIQSTISALTEIVPTDGALTANTSVNGIFGTLWRVKYTIVGTYANTTLRIDAVTSGLTTP